MGRYLPAAYLSVLILDCVYVGGFSFERRNCTSNDLYGVLDGLSGEKFRVQHEELVGRLDAWVRGIGWIKGSFGPFTLRNVGVGRERERELNRMG